MDSAKVTVYLALLLLQCHWIQCQYNNGYGGWGYPPMPCYDNDKDLDILLPIILIALCKNGGLGGHQPYPYSPGCGGCGGCGCCSCGCGGCGNGCKCGCGGRCGCCCCC